MTADIVYLRCRCGGIVRADFARTGCPSCGHRDKLAEIPRGPAGAVTRRTAKAPKHSA